MNAVIMAGGEGTRLRPLTCALPKPMVPILQAPMMEHIVNLLKRHRCSKIACTLWYLPQEVTAYFRDGSDFGVSMDYYIETTPLGTAGSVKSASANFQDTFLVVSGDALTDLDLTSALNFHKSNKAMATLVLSRVPNPLSYGVVLINEQSRITQFLEKPSWSDVFSDTVNTGIYILEPEVLDFIPTNQQVDFSRDVFPQLLKNGAPLYGYVAEGYWSDVGSLPAYRLAIQDCLAGKVKLALPPEKTKGIYLEEGVELASSASLEGPLFIGKGARIGADVYLGPYTSIGPNCQIASAASLKHSTIWSNGQVGSRAQLRGTICAKNVKIQSQVALYEGSVLGEKVQVGSQAIIFPEIKVWPSKNVPSGTKLRKSLVWGSQERPSLFSQVGIKGDYRADLTPEIIVEVGLSYAAFYGIGAEILVTSDFSPLGELAKEALIVGLRSGGIHIYDGGSVTGLLTRSMVQQLNLAGALHCKTSANNQDRSEIHSWNSHGYPLSKGEERKIENIFLREDYPRLNSDRFGELVQAPNLQKAYLKSLAKLYPAGERGFTVGLHTAQENKLGQMVKEFLQLAGYSIETKDFNGLPTVVIEQEQLLFQDEQGLAIRDDAWWHIFVQDLSKRGQSEVAIPVNRSQATAEVAKAAGLRVRWTKQAPNYWMEIASELGNTMLSESGEVFPPLEPLASVGGLFNFLSSHKVALSDYRTELFCKQADVLCSWEAKGRVMRKLIENSKPDALYLDGIREQSESGWALVVPDGDEPVFRVYAEATSEVEAKNLLEHYKTLIESYGNEER